MSRVERASGSASPRHESAIGHVTGAATYVDEQHPPAGLLSLWPVQSPHAHARILDIDASRARTAPGVCAILTAQDVPGENDTGTDPARRAADSCQSRSSSTVRRWPGWWPEDEATAQAAARARGCATKCCRHCSPILHGAIATQSSSTCRPRTGESRRRRMRACRRAASAPGRDRDRRPGSFLPGNPGQLGRDRQRRAGAGHRLHPAPERNPDHRGARARHAGAPRGLPQPAHGRRLRRQGNPGQSLCRAAALAAWRTGRAVRDQAATAALDMQLTGKRHPFLARYEVGFDERRNAAGDEACTWLPTAAGAAICHRRC
jgi:xanthine dehydrogenase large subunit